MRRRGWLLGVGAAAAAGGIGTAWWLQDDAAAQQAPQALWALQLERPAGGTLAVSSLRGGPLLVNFWATWCPPCIKEMPELDRFQRDFSARHGGRVLGVALDAPQAVREFLQRRPVGYEIALAGLAGSQAMRELGNAAGVLPYSVLLDGAGRVLRRHAGETTQAELARWAADLAP